MSDDLTTKAWWVWLIGMREVGPHPADRFAARDAMAYVDHVRADLADARTERDHMCGVAGTEANAKADAMRTADVWKMRHDRATETGDALATAAAFVLAHTHTRITEDLRQGLDRAVREWKETRR